ncbi:CCA tRNA nucleotidyltransferase [Chloroflexota bacterium]
MNLTSRIEKQLPPELVEFMQAAGLIAASEGRNLYLVGGVVRDLLLGESNHDLDLVVEGDAIILAEQLTEINQAKATFHTRFRTATLKWDRWSVDIVTARSETYSKPGALPTVTPGAIDTDLYRRDFTVNTLAVELAPARWGELIDLFDGAEDVKKGLIRILHENSFIDDATRIWRALRYEQRLNFKMEPDTLRLLEYNIKMLDTVSKDRIRHELELVLKEEMPEKALRRAGELGVLEKMYPRLTADNWLDGRFKVARETTSPDTPSVELYLALLTLRLLPEVIEDFILKYKLRKTQAQTLRDTIALKEMLEELAKPEIKRSRIYKILHGRSKTALNAISIAADSQEVTENINLYLTELRYVKPNLTGKDLQKLGYEPGPRMKQILDQLLEAKLDGIKSTKEQDEAMILGW